MKQKIWIFLAILGFIAGSLQVFSIPKIYAANADFITSVDVMKYTKDTMANQLTDAQISAVVSTIVAKLKPKYIAISIPMDESADYPADSKPAPRTAAAVTQKWVDTIHAAGAKVLFRGTFSGIEGIYNFPKLVGSNRFPPGTAASAPTDGRSTWLGKIYTYITTHPSFFSEDDIWAPLPERTEGIFSDSTSFLPYDGAGIQTNYANFFIDLNKVSTAAFGKIGKSVKVGYSTNNFSEVNSGWLLPGLFATETYISVDHYGINHTPSEMESDLTNAYKKYGKRIFLQEWGDYWNVSVSDADRAKYLQSMYAVFKKLADENILAGFNYWGGWVNSGEGILVQTNGTYSINSRGQLLADFFAGFGSAAPTPTPAPTPNPSPTPTPAPGPNPNPPQSTSTQQSTGSGPVSDTQSSLDQATSAVPAESQIAEAPQPVAANQIVAVNPTPPPSVSPTTKKLAKSTAVIAAAKGSNEPIYFDQPPPSLPTKAELISADTTSDNINQSASATSNHPLNQNVQIMIYGALAAVLFACSFSFKLLFIN